MCVALIVLLIIEKKFSNAGYHNNKSTKIGETGFNEYKLLLQKLIKYEPTTKDKRKLPESPRYVFENKLKK